MASRRSLRDHRKQTRLSFTPVPSSSPAKEQYSQAIQDRLAHVRFEGSQRAQKRRVHADSRERSGLPTPEPSSQVAAQPQDASSSPLSELPKSPDPISLRDQTPPRHQTDSDEDDMPLPSSKRRKVNGSTNTNHSSPSRRSTRIRSQVPRRTSSSARSSNSQNLVAVEISSPLKRLSDLADAETTGDEEDVMPSAAGARRRRQTSPDEGFVVDDSRIDYMSSDNEPVIKRNSRKKTSIVNDFIASDDEIEFITSEEDGVAVSARKYRRRRDKSSRTPKTRTREEQDELDDDLADLQDDENEVPEEEGEEEVTPQRRTRGGPVTTQHDKAREHFEKLRRRRAGEAIPRVEDTEQEEEDDDEDVQEVDIDQIEHAIRQAGNDQDSTHSSLDSEPGVQEVIHDEDDFIVKENAPTNTPRRGRPESGIPLRFTSFASAKPKELFIHIIEWLVKNKIAPAFARDDELYNLSWSRVDDQVKAQAGSRLISSAWNATFKYSILARPHAHISYLEEEDAFDMRTCDACNRTNHPARYDFVLSGEAYSYQTLEPIDNDSDSEEDTLDNISRDEAGHLLASQSTHFYLGRFCAANAEMGHKLTHWKYHLNQSLMTYLEEQGVLSAEAIVAREKLNKKKREREAEAIVDSMVDTGVVEELWRGFQDDLDDARLGMEDFEGGRKGKGRGKARVGSVKTRLGQWNGNRFSREVRLESDSEGE